MHTPGADGRRHTEATGIFSPDGEYLPFSSPVITESRPEEWLNKVEAAMFATTKKHLFKTLEESRGSKKEKWLKDNPGQCVITAGQVGIGRRHGLHSVALAERLTSNTEFHSAMQSLESAAWSCSLTPRPLVPSFPRIRPWNLRSIQLISLSPVPYRPGNRVKTS